MSLSLCSWVEGAYTNENSAIALPTQSITVVKDENAPTTKRKLTIDDLLAHLKHYSPSVKKGEFFSLQGSSFIEL